MLIFRYLIGIPWINVPDELGAGGSTAGGKVQAGHGAQGHQEQD